MGSLGKVKVDDVIRIPLAVERFFDLHEGDFLEFWSPPSSIHEECMIVKIVRTKKGRK